MFRYRGVSLACIVFLTAVSSQIGAHNRNELAPTFLNPKMQKQYEQDSKVACVNVGRAVAAYSGLKEILVELKRQGKTLRHFDSQTEPELLKRLNIFTLDYFPGFATFESVEGRHWEDIPDSEPVIQFADSSSMFAINKYGIEFEEFMPDSHIFSNPEMRTNNKKISPLDQLRRFESYKKFTRVRMLLAFVKAEGAQIIYFDTDSGVMELGGYPFFVRNGERLRVLPSATGRYWTDLKAYEPVAEFIDATGKYAVDKRGYEIIGDE